MTRRAGFNRFAYAIVAATAGWSAVPASVMAQAGREGITDAADVAYIMRDAMGLDAITLAALDVSTETYDTVALDAILHARQDTVELGPLATQWHQARTALGEPTTRGDAQAALASVTHARTALRQRVSVLHATFINSLDPAAQAALANVASNAGLDPLICLLPLTADQRSTAWSATLERDAIVRNPYRWHRTSQVSAARERFDAAIAETLTVEQREQLNGYETLAEQNLLWAMQRDQIAIQTAQLHALLEHIRPTIAWVRGTANRWIPMLTAWAMRTNDLRAAQASENAQVIDSVSSAYDEESPAFGTAVSEPWPQVPPVRK